MVTANFGGLNFVEYGKDNLMQRFLEVTIFKGKFCGALLKKKWCKLILVN